MGSPLDPRAFEAFFPESAPAARHGEAERRISTLERAGSLAYVPLVTALPSSYPDGGVIRYQTAAMAALPGAPEWTFARREAATTYKWDFIGGSDVYQMVNAGEVVGSSATWVDLATVGPSWTVPLAGYYACAFGALSYLHNRANNSFVGVSVNSATPGDPVGRVETPDTGSAWSAGMHVPVFQQSEVGPVSAGAVLKLMYWYSNAGSGTFARRTLKIRPIRVSS